MLNRSFTASHFNASNDKLRGFPIRQSVTQILHCYLRLFLKERIRLLKLTVLLNSRICHLIDHYPDKSADNISDATLLELFLDRPKAHAWRGNFMQYWSVVLR